MESLPITTGVGVNKKNDVSWVLQLCLVGFSSPLKDFSIKLEGYCDTVY